MGRMRAKRNIPIRMERCHERWFEDPILNKGHWRQACGFGDDIPVWLEIGCGKGKFCTQMAEAHPEVLYIAMEKEPSVILAAIEKAHEMAPEDRSYMQTLKALYYRFGMDDKYAEISEKLNNL